MEFTRRTAQNVRSVSYDEGLRSYMIGVFNNMFVALLITGLTAFFTISTPILELFFSPTGSLSGFGWLVTFAPLAFVFFFSYKLMTVQTSTARLMLWGFSALMGLSLAPIFLAYTAESITRVFFITSSMFAGMSIWGYTTKRDLTGMGSFLVMGLIGIIIASLVNIFMQSSAINFVVSFISVIIFTGLTAYDVQKIARIYQVSAAGDLRDKLAIQGALSLYLDFINLFLSMLRLFGDRK
jgi:FtsH-binding integral membrane protein